MIEISIPGRETYHIEHVVFDVNGTLAQDGVLLPGVKAALTALRHRVHVHMLTADTHGRQADIDAELGFRAERIGSVEEKAAFVRELGAAHVVAVGNGANDAAMLRAAALGIAVLGAEGLAVEALTAADIVVPDILTALDLLLHPRRIVATLRR